MLLTFYKSRSNSKLGGVESAQSLSRALKKRYGDPLPPIDAANVDNFALATIGITNKTYEKDMYTKVIHEWAKKSAEEMVAKARNSGLILMSVVTKLLTKEAEAKTGEVIIFECSNINIIHFNPIRCKHEPQTQIFRDRRGGER
jgi:hypothetical protein